MTRTLAVLLLVCLVVSGVTAGEAENARLAAFFEKYLEEEFRHRPTMATRLGEHRFDDRLDDLSPKARAAGVERTRSALRDLERQIDPKKLDRSAQIDFEILRHHLRRNIWLAENTRVWEEDPRVYNECISESVWLLLTQSTVPKADAVRSCASRMKRIPAVVDAAMASLEKPPKVYAETAVRQNRGAISFYESGIFELAGETAQLSELRPAAREVATKLKEYQRFLEGPLSERATGAWRIGKEKFARKLELELDAGLTADEVLAEAEAEFARVEREMYVVARQLWAQTLPSKVIPTDDSAGRVATIRLVLAELANDHGKVEDLVQDARATVDRIRVFIKEKDILRLPEPDRCKVLEMPEFQRGFSVAYLNPAPPLDPKADSVYAVSPPPREWDARKVTSYLEEYNRHMLQLLTIHEAYPGHYVQLEYANRHPSKIRRILDSGVFAEGWAVYTEQMMLDQGYGKGDLALRLHQLKWYLRTVANAILDHRMHCANMTDEEALQFLTGRAFQSEGEALGKVVRAKLSSCQLSTYFVGRTAFYRLRQKVQRERGEKFELGRFHEEVLSHGTLPVKYLPELVRAR
jgi:uncharacterized protein (DUF885 family)